MAHEKQGLWNPSCLGPYRTRMQDLSVDLVFGAPKTFGLHVSNTQDHPFGLL